MHKQSLSGADQKLYEIAEEIAMKGYDVTQYERWIRQLLSEGARFSNIQDSLYS